MPPAKGILGAGCEKDTWGIDLTMVAQSAVSDKSAASSKPAGYGIYNLTNRTYYDPLAVKNVTSLSDLYSESGRYFKLSLTQRSSSDRHLEAAGEE